MHKRAAAVVYVGLVFGTGGLAASASIATAPPGATALCVDGTYSFSQHHSGTCSHHGGVAKWLDRSSSGTTSSSSSSSSVGTNPPLGHVVYLGPGRRSVGCKAGVLPDRRCSPGAYYSGLTKAVLCSSTFRTGTIRNVPQSEKFAVEREYGMPPKPYGRTIEIDHIISLELGGANVIGNLYPEPGSGVANYYVKDKLENRLHAMVCAGQITLLAARRGIASNWKTLYKHIFGIAPSTS